jgi:hypothetical protein
MVQDLGLEDVGTIRTMAHWDSKRTSLGGLNGDGMTSALYLHISQRRCRSHRLELGSHLTCVTALSQTVKKMGHGRHLEQGVCTFSYTFYALLGVTSNCRHKVLWFRSLSSLTSPAYGNVGLSSSTTANLKPSLYFSVPIITFQKLIHV